MPSRLHQAVDDDLDGVLLVAGQPLVVLEEVGDVGRLAVDPGPDVALAGEVGEQRVVLALAAPHDRRQHLEAGALGQLGQAVDDLLRGLAVEPHPVLGAVGHADAGVQQAEVVVDLGDGAHRRPGVAGGRLLVDGDGRRQALDEVDVGLVHLAQELPGVGAQRLHVAPLALGVDGVEGQAGLAGAGQAGEDDQPVAGQLDVHVLEVVLPGTADDELVERHRVEPTDGPDRDCPGSPDGHHGAHRPPSVALRCERVFDPVGKARLPSVAAGRDLPVEPGEVGMGTCPAPGRPLVAVPEGGEAEHGEPGVLGRVATRPPGPRRSPRPRTS